MAASMSRWGARWGNRWGGRWGAIIRREVVRLNSRILQIIHKGSRL
jgi:hypothetical protein